MPAQIREKLLATLTWYQEPTGLAQLSHVPKKEAAIGGNGGTLRARLALEPDYIIDLRAALSVACEEGSRKMRAAAVGNYRVICVQKVCRQLVSVDPRLMFTEFSTTSARWLSSDVQIRRGDNCVTTLTILLDRGLSTYFPWASLQDWDMPVTKDSAFSHLLPRLATYKQGAPRTVVYPSSGFRGSGSQSNLPCRATGS